MAADTVSLDCRLAHAGFSTRLTAKDLVAVNVVTFTQSRDPLQGVVAISN